MKTLLISVLLFGGVARAEEPKPITCVSYFNDGVTFILSLLDRSIRQDARVEVAGYHAPGGQYVIAKPYAFSFTEYVFDLGYRRGFSHGTLRLRRNFFVDGSSYRLEQITGHTTVSADLVCDEMPGEK